MTYSNASLNFVSSFASTTGTAMLVTWRFESNDYQIGPQQSGATCDDGDTY